MATPRRFSMLRSYSLADLATLGNAFCGFGALLALLQHAATGAHAPLMLAFALLPLALVLDVVDGRLARGGRFRASTLGPDLDSLADTISFGVAPAALGFVLGLKAPLDVVCLLFFVGAGISRLARYNVSASALTDEATGKVRYFEGAPIPTSLSIVLLLFVLYLVGRTGAALPFGELQLGPFGLHPLSLIFVAHGSAMVSKTLRIPKW